MAGNKDGYRQRSSQKGPYDLFDKPSSPFRKTPTNEDSGYSKTPLKELETDFHHSRASDQSWSSISQDKNNQEQQIASRRFSKWPTMTRILSDFKKNIEPSLRTLLEELSRKDLDMEHLFEIADSANVLALFSFSNPELEALCKTAGDGQKKLREGLMLVKQGHDLLRSAVTGMMLRSSL